MHNMEKCGRGKGRPQGCSLRSHRRRRLAPLPPPFSPAPMLRQVIYASLLHFGVETAAKGVADPLLGPVFTSAISDLPAHLEVIKNFWSRSLLGTERYQGHPYPVHTSLRIEPEHFQRWLELFIESVRETLPEPQAGEAVGQASHIAQCFQAGIFPFTDANGKLSRLPPH